VHVARDVLLLVLLEVVGAGAQRMGDVRDLLRGAALLMLEGRADLGPRFLDEAADPLPGFLDQVLGLILGAFRPIAELVSGLIGRALRLAPSTVRFLPRALAEALLTRGAGAMDALFADLTAETW
jgi:hypothetical protein